MSYPPSPAQLARADGIRRLSRLTWRITQMSAIATVAFAVRVSSRAGGGAWLIVTDEGPGFSDPDPTLRGMSSGGSTGLGLDIARRIAETSGGTLVPGHSPEGGGAVTVGLGPAVAAARQERRHVRARPHLPMRSRRAEDARLAAELSEWEDISGRDLNMR